LAAAVVAGASFAAAFEAAAARLGGMSEEGFLMVLMRARVDISVAWFVGCRRRCGGWCFSNQMFLRRLALALSWRGMREEGQARVAFPLHLFSATQCNWRCNDRCEVVSSTRKWIVSLQCCEQWFVTITIRSSPARG
jgi:hypothetical protein